MKRETENLSLGCHLISFPNMWFFFKKITLSKQLPDPSKTTISCNLQLRGYACYLMCCSHQMLKDLSNCGYKRQFVQFPLMMISINLVGTQRENVPFSVYFSLAADYGFLYTTNNAFKELVQLFKYFPSNKKWWIFPKKSSIIYSQKAQARKWLTGSVFTKSHIKRL